LRRSSPPIVNAADVDRLCRADRVFAGIRERYGIPPNWSRESGFRSLCQIILEQQVSLESARAHFNRLSAYLPEVSATEILKLTDDEMRRCQVTRQKAGYLRALSTAVESGDLDFSHLDAAGDDEVRARLTAVKGIGTWTADVYLMFCLGRKDHFPIGDVAVRNAVAELYGITERERQRELSERWKPLRSLASFFLWHHYLVQRGRAAPGPH